MLAINNIRPAKATTQWDHTSGLIDLQRRKEAIKRHLKLTFALAIAHLNSIDYTESEVVESLLDEAERPILEQMGKGPIPGVVVIVLGWVVKDFREAQDAGLVDRMVVWHLNMLVTEMIASFNAASKISR